MAAVIWIDNRSHIHIQFLAIGVRDFFISGTGFGTDRVYLLHTMPQKEATFTNLAYYNRHLVP